mmetsp:Transcript_27972/g.32099  ORF Transcript_27972/g.32099 Transcript_27972/m.32099 type:complete len:93 (+) Transcript_27972:68-346(+)|eukprot:CAMPEP_0115009318 /NCGR_PEP_ID=MMETSP0216-20121206/22535_1 /TAXON_ID=223996 /ORGANISM="Protocruzia adherens, Strain Boccale" /LENGTH=92 /DNA_ID=CAMNT_0002377091 /DNA_START=35 /DNA_END=313 /DNA_ORIENTATION=+
MSKGQSCAIYCSIVSTVGFLFLGFLGILLSSDSEMLKIKEDRTAGARACFIAAGLYLAFAGISIYSWVQNNKKARDAALRNLENGGGYYEMQ